MHLHSMENERLNIWVVLLNLENLYGTEESLASVFKSALMQNNQEKLYWKMVMIYVKSGKHDVSLDSPANVHCLQIQYSRKF